MAVRSATETADAIRRRELRAVDALAEARERVEQSNPELIAFVHLDWELAKREAEEVDRRVDRGVDPGPLAGVPFGV